MIDPKTITRDLAMKSLQVVFDAIPRGKVQAIFADMVRVESTLGAALDLLTVCGPLLLLVTEEARWPDNKAIGTVEQLVPGTMSRAMAHMRKAPAAGAGGPGAGGAPAGAGG